MRRALWLAAPALLFLTLAARAAELKQIGQALAASAPAWVLAAFLLQAVFAIIQSGTYQAIFRLLGAEVSLRTALRLSLAMAFGSLALPFGTTSGIPLFVFAARRLGLSGPRALWTSLAYYLFDYTALLLLLAAGALGLALRHDLHLPYVVAMGLFGAAPAAAAAIAGWSLRHPSRASRALALALGHGRRLARRLRGRALSSGAEIRRWAGDAEEALRAAASGRSSAAPAFLLTLAGQGLGVLTLAASLRAVGYSLEGGLLVAAYAVGTLVMVVSITPSGVGIVEGALTVTLASFGIPLTAAVAGTLLFRLFTFWLPLAAGFAVVRRLGLEAAQPETASGPRIS